MAKKDALLLVSRALALYLLCWAFSEVTYVPSLLFSLTHHMGEQSVLATADYLTDHDVLSLALLVFRLVTLFGVAAWFYTCGPSGQGYFWPDDKNVDAATHGDGQNAPPTLPS